MSAVWILDLWRARPIFHANVYRINVDDDEFRSIDPRKIRSALTLAERAVVALERIATALEESNELEFEPEPDVTTAFVGAYERELERREQSRPPIDDEAAGRRGD